MCQVSWCVKRDTSETGLVQPLTVGWRWLVVTGKERSGSLNDTPYPLHKHWVRPAQPGYCYHNTGELVGAETGDPPRAGWHLDRLMRPKLLGGRAIKRDPGRARALGPDTASGIASHCFEPSDWMKRKFNWDNERRRNIFIRDFGGHESKYMFKTAEGTQ